MTLYFANVIKGVNYDSRADKDARIKKNVKARHVITVYSTVLIT